MIIIIIITYQIFPNKLFKTNYDQLYKTKNNIKQKPQPKL